MKKRVDLYFLFGSVSHKPSCQVVNPESGEVLAFATRDNWEEVEKAAIREAEKHLAAGSPPPNKTVEINAPEPVELTEVVETDSPDEGDRNIVEAITTMPREK